MLNSNFSFYTNAQLLPFVLAIGLILFSLIFFLKGNNERKAIVLLILGGFSLRIFMILLDPFLNMWDEQYHALVAKNMMQHPFIPLLYKVPLFPYDIENWVGNHVWLHKQPFFMWLMALSMKLFGVNEFAVRFPSALMSAFMILLIFRIGKLSVNSRSGYIAAFLYCFASYSLELMAGYHHTDHNDTAFIFYVTASIWAFTEYLKSKRRFWVIWIGLFAGIAVLNKWLTGLLVFSGWAFWLLADRNKRNDISYYWDILLGIGITFAVFLPWQIYILNMFPLESKVEYAYNTTHFFHAVEGHVGDWKYHFKEFPKLYNHWSSYLAIPAFLVLIYRTKIFPFKIAYATWVIGIYFFFTLAQTKMPAFTLVVSALIYLSLGAFFDYLISYFETFQIFKTKKIWITGCVFILLIILGASSLKFDQITKHHSFKTQGEWDYRGIRNRDTQVYKSLDKLLPEGKFVLFNVRQSEHILVMFYTNHIAYEFIPSFEDFLRIKSLGYKIAIFDDGKLPDYIMDDNETIKIRSGVWMVEN